MNGKFVSWKVFCMFRMILITDTLHTSRLMLLKYILLQPQLPKQRRYLQYKIKPSHSWFHFRLSGTSFSECYNSLAVKVLLKIRVQSCARRFSLQRQKFPSSNILHIYLEQFSLYFLNAKEKSCDVKDRCVGLAKRENSGISISCCKQVWAWLIKEAENTTGSNEFSHYCSIQGAPSPWKHHPLVRQTRSCLHICRYKKLRFPRESKTLGSVCSPSLSRVLLHWFTV